MKQIMIAFVLLVFSTISLAGDGYVQTGRQGIMHFVQIDPDKATDFDTYIAAREALCSPGVSCQVIYWTQNAPRRMPFTREQTKGKTAYWQFDGKKNRQRLYVDCDLLGTNLDAECL